MLPSESSPLPDEVTLLLELLDGIAHDLGSTAGGLRMRAAALRLGAPATGTEVAMQMAATRLARTQHAARLLMGLQHRTHSQRPVAATEWQEAMVELLPTMLGPGYRVELTPADATIPATAVSGLSASLLAHARGYREEPRAPGVVHPVALRVSLSDSAFEVALEVQRAASENAASKHAAPPQLGPPPHQSPSAWTRLAEQIAIRHALRMERTGARTVWRASLEPPTGR